MKDISIQTALNRLTENLGAEAFVVVDMWEDDDFAVGVAHPQDAQQLLYFSTFELPAEHYFIVFETAPDANSDLPYADEGDDLAESFDELLKMVKQHLQIPA